MEWCCKECLEWPNRFLSCKLWRVRVRVTVRVRVRVRIWVWVRFTPADVVLLYSLHAAFTPSNLSV